MVFPAEKYLHVLILVAFANTWYHTAVHSIPHARRAPLDAFFWSVQKSVIGDNLQHPTVQSFRSFSCVGRNDKLYPDISTQCETYYRCLGGVSYSYVCPRGHALDMESQECMAKSEVKCVLPSSTTQKCWYQPDGFYPNYTDSCRSYYSCLNGTVVEEGQCDGDSIWDSATGSCGSGAKVSCTRPSCLGFDDGSYPLQGSACTAYYSCKDGYRTDMLCPHGSIFEYMQKQCIAGPEAVCYEKACEGKVNGLHAAPQAPCDTFYECFNSAMIRLQKCSDDQIFDGRRCVPETAFTCVREGQAGRGSCVHRHDGAYAAEDLECRGFFFCKHHQLVRSFQCGRGLAFNGRTCVNNANFICTSRPPIPNCYNKFDGYYTIDTTNCNRFYRCKSSEKLSEHACPGNHVFNGRQCVDPRLFSCPFKAMPKRNPIHHHHH